MGFFEKIKAGLTRTKENIGHSFDQLFAGELNDDFYDELEETLILGDMGVDTTMKAVEELRRRVKAEKIKDMEGARTCLRRVLTDMLQVGEPALKLDTTPSVALFIGVNGVGKTTTIGKIGAQLRHQGKKVLFCAADTFRAAAVEQLGIWAERTGSGFHSKGQDADPAAVAWEAMDVAIRDQYDILFIDTAGRLHTKSNLMDELHKIREVIARKHPGAPHRSILIVDATTGQNALQQTKIFKEAAGIDELILTKLDGTAKGGVAVAVSMQYGIPITYVGLGEKMEDLRPFNGDDFAKALLEQ